MNNEEKITVLNSQKPMLPKPVIILIGVAIIAIILLAGYFYLQKSFFKQKQPSPIPLPATDQNLPKPVSPPKDTTNSPPPLPTFGPIKK